MISLQSSVICFQEGFFQHDFSKQFFSVAYFGVPNSKNNQDLGVCQNGLFWCAKINNQASKNKYCSVIDHSESLPANHSPSGRLVTRPSYKLTCKEVIQYWSSEVRYKLLPAFRPGQTVVAEPRTCEQLNVAV